MEKNCELKQNCDGLPRVFRGDQKINSFQKNTNVVWTEVCFLCKKRSTLKKYFWADSKEDAYLAWRFACCFQKAARFLLGENTSCHLVCLTVLQAAHPWTVEKKKYRLSKKKIKIVVRVEKVFFTRGMGNHCKRTARYIVSCLLNLWPTWWERHAFPQWRQSQYHV